MTRRAEGSDKDRLPQWDLYVRWDRQPGPASCHSVGTRCWHQRGTAPAGKLGSRICLLAGVALGPARSPVPPSPSDLGQDTPLSGLCFHDRRNRRRIFLAYHLGQLFSVVWGAWYDLDPQGTFDSVLTQFGLSQLGDRYAPGIEWGEARDAAEHSAPYRTAAHIALPSPKCQQC